jgi:regulator of RNase E activity RraA
VLFGPAVTISFLPYRQDLMDDRRHTLGPLFYDAIADGDPAGQVLVLASNGHQGISLGGGTKLSRVGNHDMAGVLADGRLRDFEELAELGVAVWCTGETTKAGGAQVRPYQANVPVGLAGVTIVPGDYVMADRSGAVVIPAADVDEVLSAARQMAAMAANMQAMIRNENADEVRQGSDELLL